MKDPQKKKVYAWEDSWWGWNRSTVSYLECQRVIRRACRLFKVKPPIVIEHSGRRYSEYDPETDTISMRSEKELNIPISLHEATHAIIWKLYGEKVQDHGPEFVGVYLWLLAEFQVAPAAAIFPSAETAGLEWVLTPPMGR